MKIKQSIKKGFTLVELLIVIAIIAILSAVVGINAFKSIEKSKITRTLNDVKVFKTAALQFYTDVGFFPADVSQGVDPGLGCKSINDLPKSYINVNKIGMSEQQYKDIVQSKWSGPYLDFPLSKSTAWGGKYDYECWGLRSDNANGVSAGIYISVHGLSEESAKALVQQGSFEVAKGSDKNGEIQNDDVESGKKKVTFKIADWPSK